VCQGFNLGVAEYALQSNHVKMFPNPASEVLNIEISMPDVRITRTIVSDLAGREVVRQWQDGYATARVDLSKIDRAGVYLVTIETSAGSITRKVNVLQ
jgi:hypothetical protein